MDNKAGQAAPRNVLAVWYHFPPIAGAGVLRRVQFSRYLPQFGWVPIVLTIRAGDNIQYTKDPSLLSRVPPGTPVVRTKSLEAYDNWLYRRLFGRKPEFAPEDEEFAPEDEAEVEEAPKAGWKYRLRETLHGLVIPDRHVGWLPFAVREGLALASRTRIDAIWSSAPPPTAHLIAYVLSRRLGVPWIAHFADPWSLYPLAPKRPFPFAQMDRFLERKVLERATLVVSTTERCNESFLDLYPHLDATKFKLLPNGYAEEDFSRVSPRVFDKFTIIFGGMLYEGSALDEIFGALRSMLDDDPELRDDLQFLFIGNQYLGFDDKVAEWKLEAIVGRMPHMEHRDYLAHLMGGHACFYNLVASTDRSSSALWISSKIYEYLRSGTPILAVVPPGHPVRALLDGEDLAAVFSRGSHEGLKRRLLDLYRRYQAGEPLRRSGPPGPRLTQYERKNQCEQLASWLDATAGDGPIQLY